MIPYQTLLDEAVGLLNPERGFIVLRDASTNKPTGFAAVYNFDVEATQQPIGDITDEHQYIWEELPYYFSHTRAGVTTNTVVGSYYRRFFTRWTLRSVMMLPLRQNDIMYGLLWCDQGFMTRGEWTAYQLRQAITLVDQFHKMP